MYMMILTILSLPLLATSNNKPHIFVYQVAALQIFNVTTVAETIYWSRLHSVGNKYRPNLNLIHLLIVLKILYQNLGQKL